jgi:hypothetical protein
VVFCTAQCEAYLITVRVGEFLQLQLKSNNDIIAGTKLTDSGGCGEGAN